MLKKLIPISFILFFCLLSNYGLAAVEEESLKVEEFFVPFEGRPIPSRIVLHTNKPQLRPTLILIHGGPIDAASREIEDLTGIAGALGVNAVTFDFRGSKLKGYKIISDAPTPFTDVCRVTSDYGGAHMNELKSVVQYISKHYPVDPDQLILEGESYGGYLSLVAITDPEYSRTFKLAILWSGFYDLQGTSLAPGDFSLTNCPGDETNPNIRRRRSPMSFVENVTQPIILVHGGPQDLTTLVSYRKTRTLLKRLRDEGKKVYWINIPKESHSFSDEGEQKVLMRIKPIIDQYFPHLASLGD